MSDWLDTLQGILGLGKNKDGGYDSILPDIIKAAGGLAGSYYEQSSKKSLAEQYAQQQAAANQIEREKTLASMYSSWAENRRMAGAQAANTAQQTGKNMTDALNARAYVLK